MYLFCGHQDVFYRFENIACLSQDRDWIEGSGHGLPVQCIPVPELTQQFLFNAYLPTLRGNGNSVRPLLLVAAN